ncbi:MAG: phosphatase PAP2 family protein [Chitinophagaceae bacterium]
MNLFEKLIALDEQLFIAIHANGAASWLDPLMLGARNAITWVPLYLFVLYWIIRYRRNHALLFLLGTLLTFAITDFVSASVLKPLIGRERPCYNEAFTGYLRNLIGCGGRNSFPSTHASNHFGMAAFWFFSLRAMGVRRWYWVWIWALLIGYAQIYVGKHYPLDILGGAIFGAGSGYLVSLLFARLTGKKTQPGKRTTFDPLP